MTLQDLKTIVEAYAKIGDINSIKRTHDFVEARWIYFTLARLHTKKPLVSIGELVRRDHTSVLYGLSQFDLYKDDLRFMKGVFELCNLEIAKIKNGVVIVDMPESLSFTEQIKRLEFTTSELMKTVNALINGLPVEYQTIEL